MVKYVSFCRDYGESWAHMVLVQNTPFYTRRDYKEVLGIMMPRVVSGVTGTYAEVFRVKEGTIPVRVLRVDVVSSREWFPTITTEVYINDRLARSFYIAE